MVARVPDGVASDAPLLLVGDTMDGLEALGRASRARTGARIVAVTGSAGKTGVKEAIRHCLSRRGETAASAGSLNNQWGVPLSLARMSAAASFGVFEAGMNHRGRDRAPHAADPAACCRHHQYRGGAYRVLRFAGRHRRCEGGDFRGRGGGRRRGAEPRLAAVRPARRPCGARAGRRPHRHVRPRSAGRRASGRSDRSTRAQRRDGERLRPRDQLQSRAGRPALADQQPDRARRDCGAG